MDFFSAQLLDNLSVTVVFAAVALSVITDKLVWHTRLKKAEARADQWEKIALDALRQSASACMKVAETTVGIVHALPDPSDGEEDGT